jgi:hypothetical protein
MESTITMKYLFSVALAVGVLLTPTFALAEIREVRVTTTGYL